MRVSADRCLTSVGGEVRLNKLILKTALITLACVLALALLLFGVFSLFVPSVMVSLTDKLGMESACARYSAAVYEKSGAIDDLAVAVERNYGAGRYEAAAEYGTELLQRDDFDSYSAARDADSLGLTASYAQYAAGIVSVAQYYSGAADAAVRTAFDACGIAFPQNNAVVYLIDAAMNVRADTAACRVLLTRLQELQSQLSPSAAEDSEYISVWIDQLNAFCAG